ncbi:S41 family peptidase [Pseudidiomarina sediminum]|uniref:S41 family peptidase n=1 Tax=Pseudidiomarina sediminum TaxID=431675 RepID=UPI001C979E37|nr:S41 family peptidase [Pseudidiomarina sediminum]MBY6064115.1 peptidase [Pseudidiomarina sediminum]
MFPKILIYVLVLLGLTSCSQPKPFHPEQSWQHFVQTVEDNYAYLDTAPVDWPALKAYYAEQAKQVNSEAELVDLLQVVKQFFMDPHFNVGPLNADDFSVTPTGSDIWATQVDGVYVIERIKAESAAASSQLQVGQRIVAIDGHTIEANIAKVFGETDSPLSNAHKLWAVNVALGGLRNGARTIDIEAADGVVQKVHLAATYEAINKLKEQSALVVKEFGSIGYIRFNNNLGNSQTVDAFHEAITALSDTQGLIIDLRNTPSGGNTGVAEPILGHFVTEKSAYQKYRVQTAQQHYTEAPLQTAFVTPTAPYYAKPFVVLAGRWTGSMGEGMTIGFDALGAKAIIGQPMADLLGGINQFTLPDSAITLELGFERLYHVNGTFREDFVPQAPTPCDRQGEQGCDAELVEALRILVNSPESELY